MAEVAFADSEFLDGAWELQTVVVGPSSGSVTRAATGGNPGACRVMTNLLTASTNRVDGYHLCRAAVYSPAASGAITSIRASIDACLVSSTHGAPIHDGMGFGFALRQNGKLYHGGYNITTQEVGQWKPHALDLTAADFGTLADPNDHPDFSESGAEITFGFRTANSSTSSGYTTVAKFDNWLMAVANEGPPALDAPVTLRFSESLTGVFADPTIDASFFSMVDLPVGGRYTLGDQLSSEPWYSFLIRDRSPSGGLATYSGETLLARLHRHTPTESLILVAGEGGVPDPLTLRECLVRFLDYYGVPYDSDIPEFYLRVGGEILAPTVQAFVIQPDQENPQSIYSWLEAFFGPFRGYTFRADEADRLRVAPPAWVDTIGLRLTVWRRRQDGRDRSPSKPTSLAPWSTTRRPLVQWEGTVDGVAYSGSLPAPLERGAAFVPAQVGSVTVRLQWRATDDRVQATVYPPPPTDLTVGSLFSISFTFRPEALPGDPELLSLAVSDLSPDESTRESADTVINQAVIPVRRRAFQPNQQIMQAAAMVLKSPPQLAAGAFGHNFEYGPMAEDLVTPGGFLELVNDAVQSGTWFWPIDDAVVIQPGGNITVAYEVEEWAEGPYFSTVSASMVNSFSDTVELPASGAERKLFDFQFPRQTSNFAPGPYGAQGSLYGRWRAGENPGIEVRLGNARFAEFGYVAEFLGIFGQTYYFLWGAIVKLNGSGTTFTVGDLETHRFGFSRAEDGMWEDGANVPGLSESQALYPNRIYTAPELPYEVTPETALALARGIVEENLTPKVVRTLTIVPARAGGHAARPWHVGRAASVPALGITGRVASLDYSEAHTPQGSTSSVTIDVETTAAPAGSRAAARGYRRAAYGLSQYQQED